MTGFEGGMMISRLDNFDGIDGVDLPPAHLHPFEHTFTFDVTGH